MYPITISINDAAQAMGIGRTKLYELINKGDVTAVKVGRRTLIKTSSIEAFVSNLEAA
ncbi:helix-turn-helix domain-containing protein [Sphingomicrobium astaxanthinifaciens]|uniref:helix-turn-helix domain-containing protein n=1 Tax=Sphingomicrobium astaxanthinifaciens TaxID=1227949 RepID=UPI001FCC67D3|nr:helix-turn-helix domain-containing protein [Sphingomicrobium astaxanthinifaciens]MCJ7420945.1 helix-turn-helix domain-containing protein [Sphingomicrobium astaxanthinifaciens]